MGALLGGSQVETDESLPKEVVVVKKKTSTDLLIGKTLQEAQKMVDEHEFVHRGHSIYRIIDINESGTCGQGIIAATIKDGKIVSFF